ncbi:MAG: HAMP domain-containing sensor histidine kinase [Alphaproteobacteria bacterium]
MARPSLHLPSFASGLSARLLVLTMFFVMVAEVFIYAPSIARYRLTYLQEKLADGHLATVTFRMTPDEALREDMRNELLNLLDAYLVDISWPGGYDLMVADERLPEVDISVDLSQQTFFGLIWDAFGTLMQSGNRIIAVRGTAPKDPRAQVTMHIDEWPLRAEMLDYSRRILLLSLMISAITAALVFLALQWLTVRPIRRMTENMIRFAQNPEDVTRTIRPGGRTDEIGLAQRQLAAMQTSLRDLLRQKSALAALGAAVAKINHDLRNILSSALLVSDSLAASADPEAQRQAPKVAAAIERAIRLCGDVLSFARRDAPKPRPSRFVLADLVAEIVGDLTARYPQARVEAAVDPGLVLNADHEQLRRAFDNVIRNALEAGAHTVSVGAHSEGDRMVVEIGDDGPGVPPKIAEHLFQPFGGSVKAEGSGLGLAIAQELVAAHGGAIALVETGSDGTLFRITLPAVMFEQAA